MITSWPRHKMVMLTGVNNLVSSKHRMPDELRGNEGRAENICKSNSTNGYLHQLLLGSSYCMFRRKM